MSYYESVVLNDIVKKRDRKAKGMSNGVPNCFARYNDVFSHFERGQFIQILGATGEGKSSITRHMFVYHTLKYSWENSYPVKVLFLALEDSKLLVYKKFIKHYLWERYGIILPAKYIESKDLPLAQKYLDLLEMDKEFYEQFEKSIFIVNDAITPKQILDLSIKFHEKYGESNHLFLVVDNFSNVQKDPHHRSEWEALKELSADFIRLKLCKNYDFTVVGILQQDFDQVKFSARNVGKSGIAAIEPNLSSIGDSKIVSRSAHIVLALFSPHSLDIKAYPFADGYNIDVLRQRFRSLLMLKNNNEEKLHRLPLYFDGSIETFTELPSLDQKEELEKIYNKVIQEEREKKDRFLLGQKKLWT